MNPTHKIGVLLLIAIIGCHQPDKTKATSVPENRPEIREIKLVDVNGHPIELERFRGKTIFINFWATWCKPCMQEMPSIARAQDILQNNNVVFLMASAESAEQTQEVRLNSKYKFTYAKIENFESLNIQALPTTFIFNPKGGLVFSEMGSRDWDDTSNINLILNIAKQHD